MGIWIELGIFALALAFGLWQIHDVKRARERTRREREAKALEAEAGVETGEKGGPNPGR